MSLTRYLAPAVLAASLGAAAFAAPTPAQAQSDDWVRVLVNVADVVMRGNTPYYRYGDYGYDDRLVMQRDRYGRPVYYRYVPREAYYDRGRPPHGNAYGYNRNRGYPVTGQRSMKCDKHGKCRLEYYDARYDRDGRYGYDDRRGHGYRDGRRWRDRDPAERQLHPEPAPRRAPAITTAAVHRPPLHIGARCLAGPWRGAHLPHLARLIPAVRQLLRREFDLVALVRLIVRVLEELGVQPRLRLQLGTLHKSVTFSPPSGDDSYHVSSLAPFLRVSATTFNRRARTLGRGSLARPSPDAPASENLAHL